MQDEGEHNAPKRWHGLEFQPVFIILSSLIFFTLFWYFGRRAFYVRHLTESFPTDDLSPIYPFFYFCVASVFFRTLLPILCIRFVLKRPLADFGFGFTGGQGTGRIYFFLFLSVLPFVYLASTTVAFQAYYPQFKQVIVDHTVMWEHLLIFELVYGLLFLSGESFWRGYIVFGLEEKFGYYAILIMVIPYVMSHYEKPFLETMGAIVTGCVLGYLALKHRHFWFGVLVHWGVAVTMDLLALRQLGVEII